MTASAPPPTTARVLAYNVRSLRDSQTRAPSVVRALAPDVAMLAETPRFLRWRSRLAAFARRAGLLYGAGGGPRLGGTALLTGLRTDVLATAVVPLSKHPRHHRRGAAVVVARLGGVPVLFASVHMSLDERERVTHAHELVDHLERLRQAHGVRHVVVGGDLNERPGGPARQVFADAGLHDAWALVADPGCRGGEMTFPAAAPTRRIDAVLVSAGVHVRWVGVPAQSTGVSYAAASDHLPVVAELTLPAG